MNFIKALTLALLASFGCAVSAQQALSGVRQVDIVVETLDDDAAKCSITKDGIDAAVRLPLSNSRIRIDRDAPAYLYVNANVMVMPNRTCVANLLITFKKYSASERSMGDFWNKGTLMSGAPDYVSQRIYINAENLTKQFVAAWLQANP